MDASGCSVIALITLLVLFIVALADGLGGGNRGYLQISTQPSIIVSQDTFNLVKPGALPNPADWVSNIIVVQLQEPTRWKDGVSAYGTASRLRQPDA